MWIVVESLLPVALLIALGAALRHWHFAGEAFREQLDLLTYWVLLPALIIQKLGTADLNAVPLGPTLISLVVLTVAATLAGMAWVRLAKMPASSAGVVVQAGFRANMAFVGLPIILFTAENAGLDVARAGTIGILGMGPLILIYNLIGVAVLVVPHHGLRPSTALRLVKPMVTNPLIIACVIGVAIPLAGASLPNWSDKSLSLLGDCAGPMALLSLGMAVVHFGLRGALGKTAVAVALKLVVAPAVGLAMLAYFNAEKEVALVVAIFSACPTAVSSFVLAGQLNGDKQLAASCVAMTTVMSLVSLAVMLYIVV